jgi:hypothetical protein
MKKMHSPRSFMSPLKKFGSSQNYQNVNLAKSIMLENHKMKMRHQYSNSQNRVKNMNSIMHSTSQFDAKTGAASTLDQTMSHIHDTSMYTNVDLME